MILAENILDEVAKVAAIPTNQPSFTPASVLDIVNSEVRSVIAPSLISAGSEYLVDFKDYASPNIDANGNTYVILPERAVGSILREVHMAMPGNIAGAVNLMQITVADLGSNNGYGTGFTSAWSGKPAFLMMGNKVYILGGTSGFTVRLYYYRRPANLVETTSVGYIQTITQPDPAYYEVEITATPPAFNIVTKKFDLYQGESPYDLLGENLTCINVLGNVYRFSGTIPYGLVVGSYLSIHNEANVLQLPEEYQSQLVQAVVLRVLEILGDASSYQISNNKYTEIKKDQANLVSPRVRGELRRVRSRSNFF
jgi:hypothetical protein